MTRRRGRNVSKTKAIQNTLARLGMQASTKEVVDALANFGIDVSAGLVRRVQVDMLKEAAKVTRQQWSEPRAKRLKVQPPKIPPRRSFRCEF